MKKTLVLLSLLPCSHLPCFACPMCDDHIKDALYESQLYPNLIMFSAFIVLSVIVITLAVAQNKQHDRWRAANAAEWNSASLSTPHTVE